jgi:DNA mismatch endonuclease (patch repair protein)
MADTVSAEKRSWIMSRVKSSDTVPERLVRSLIFSLGLRFRKNQKGLRAILTS